MNTENFVSFGMLLLIVIVAAVGSVIIIPLCLRARKDSQKEKLGKMVIERARNIGPLAYFNTRSGVIAVCAEVDFQTAYELYLEEADEGKKQRTDKVVLWVYPTFVFWSDAQSQTLMHAGNEDDIRAIMDSIIYEACNVRTDDVYERDYKELLRILCPRDGRIFVPFSGKMPELEKQVSFYEKFGRFNTLHEARAYLLTSAHCAVMKVS